MYKVGTSQVTNTNKAKSVLSSTRLSASSSVRRPSNKNSSLKNSVISNTKNSSKKVEVSDRANKKSDVASKNVALNKIVTNDEIVGNKSSQELILPSQLSAKDKNGLGYRDQLNENDSSGSELFNSVFDSRLSDGDDNQTNDSFKKDNGYHVVPPPLIGNYMPPLADLSLISA
ncbi:hypothetical protein Tco_1542751 [Tanacetum coccineum]